MEKIQSPVKSSEGVLSSLGNQLALARKLEQTYKNRPDPDLFVSSMQGTKFEQEYTKEAVATDTLYVETIRNKIDEANSSFGRENLDHIEGGFQLSEIMQTMVVDRMNKNWFKGCKTIMTSDFDDLKTGIDAVMKHEKGGYLGAAFDFTITNQDKKIYEKLDKVWERNVKDGKIPVVKYFEDPDTKQKGRLLVPKFIIGASKKDVEELAAAYLVDDKTTLENHPLKYVILLQIEEQLQTALDYYETHTSGKDFGFAKTQYENIQILLRGMKRDIHMDEKMKDVDLYEYTKKSVALDMIRRFRIMRERSN